MATEKGEFPRRSQCRGPIDSGVAVDAEVGYGEQPKHHDEGRLGASGEPSLGAGDGWWDLDPRGAQRHLSLLPSEQACLEAQHGWAVGGC